MGGICANDGHITVPHMCVLGCQDVCCVMIKGCGVRDEGQQLHLCHRSWHPGSTHSKTCPPEGCCQPTNKASFCRLPQQR